MTDQVLQAKWKKENLLITIVSVAIPVVVATLFKVKIEGVDLSFLPRVYATINGLTAVVLLAALWAVKNKKIDLHRKLVTFAFVLSLLFLVGYVAYHMTSEPTVFGGGDTAKYIYLAILVTHIVLSMFVVPLALFTFVRGKRNQVEKHKKIARVTFPIWLYVAVSGVVVYLMISPYY